MDDKQVRGLRALLFEERRSPLLSDEQGPDPKIRSSRWPTLSLSKAVYWEL